MQSVKKFLYALALFCGTVIGVGLFGLPYVASKIGFIPLLFYFIGLGVVAIISVLIYGEMISRTKGKHRLPGYVGIYLGKKFKNLSFVTQTIGMTGAMLAYIIVGGGFLSDLVRPYLGGPKVLYILIFFAAGSFIIYLTSKEVAQTELVMLFFFFVVIGLLIYRCLPFISVSNFSGFNLKYFFLPYGVVLFSIWGASIVPEVKDFLAPKHINLLKPVLISGILISIITYLIFVIAILGVTGSQTTPDALTGLQNVFSDGVIIIFLIFGILTTFTSYITLGLTLKKVFWYDLKLPRLISWFLVVIIPLSLYALGITNFIVIISFTGAVTLGIDTISIFLSYLKAKTKGQKKPAYNLAIPQVIVYTLVGLFLIGIIVELITIEFY
jgi:tyrosine-specific transport protein